MIYPLLIVLGLLYFIPSTIVLIILLWKEKKINKENWFWILIPTFSLIFLFGGNDKEEE